MMPPETGETRDEAAHGPKGQLAVPEDDPAQAIEVSREASASATLVTNRQLQREGRDTGYHVSPASKCSTFSRKVATSALPFA